MLRYRGKLSELFPPDDELAPALARLAIIRHDLGFELRELELHSESTPDDVYRLTYFLRRISISLCEAENVLNHNLGKYLKLGKHGANAATTKALNDLRAEVLAARPVLEGVRDVIGAHLEPKNDKDRRASNRARGPPHARRLEAQCHDRQQEVRAH